VKIFTILLQWKIASINASLKFRSETWLFNLKKFEAGGSKLDRAWILYKCYSGTPQFKNFSTSFQNSNQFIKNKK
jgi:hypothetical protein